MSRTVGGLALTEGLREEARRLGFTLFGVTRPDPSEHSAFYEAWLDAGHHGEMAYLARDDARARRAEPASSFPGVRSVVVVGHEYGSAGEYDGAEPSDGRSALIARYAHGSEYHHVIPERLAALLEWLDRRVEGGARGRTLVDTAPVLERELAHRAGLGWFGRNTMLIDPRRGSYFLLGLLMVDVELDVATAPVADRCGTCTSCIDACPTGALLGRRDSGAPVIDARRCISYLTIELKGPIPRDDRAGIGNRVFGCDICQEVCPWNDRFADPRGDDAYAAQTPPDTLVDLADRFLSLSEKAYQRLHADSPLARPRRKGMLRNLMVGIGNALSRDAYGPREYTDVIRLLERALNDDQPLVRGHAAWALGQAARRGGGGAEAKDGPSATHQDGVPDASAPWVGDDASNVLRQRAAIEFDPYVRGEIEDAVGLA